MHVDLIQLLLAFVEGIGLILSPCILPILPIMLAASLDGGRGRPLGIIVGFIAAFTIFALLLRQVFAWLDVDTEIVRNVALALLVLFGLLLLSKTLSDRLLSATQGVANFGEKVTARWGQGSGFWSGTGIGALIGLIWTPCAGPIMAAAVVQIIQAKTNLEASLTVLMFALGAGIPMLLIALAGRKIVNQLGFFKRHSYGVRRVLGIIIIAMAALIYSGADVQLLAASGGSSTAVIDEKPTLQHTLPQPYLAPEIGGINAWINSEPLAMADLRGKVVLVDFWTYSCINCVRTLPHVTRWYDTYKDQGFVVLGVHAPEFDFEKKLDNVKAAVSAHKINYPVALDNNLTTWGNFKNRYWPAHYLIDRDGRVVYEHFGEGNYSITENNIRALLGIGKKADTAPEEKTFSRLQTPETYLGYARTEHFAGSVGKDVARNYSFPDFLGQNGWALNGNWIFMPEYTEAQQEKSGLRLNFLARKVFLVLGTRDGKPATVRVMLNNKPVGNGAGKDVKDGMLNVTGEALYELIDQGEMKNGLLELQTDTPGLRAYAFTFGS